MIGELEQQRTKYRKEKYQSTQLFQPEVSIDNIQGLHNTEPWSH